MADKPADNTPRGWLHALYEWLGTTSSSHPSPSFAGDPTRGGPPAHIAHYAIERKLGEGGMGVVYEARDERLKRTVALKTISPLANDETARKRFWREARAAASVNHPNICQIYEIGEDRGELFIAMELLEGEALAERLRRGPLSVSETLPVALGMLAALSALHTRGIVHRDLKPSNVFLTPHGVKLLDFGLARPELEPSLGSVTELTRTGLVMGTPRYMAPEQVTGEAVDARVDLFAAGAILFEMLSGRPAFTGRTVLEILHATVNEQPPALTDSPAVAAVDRVIRRALAKRPADRPASADAMAEQLRAVRGDVLADLDAVRPPSGIDDEPPPAAPDAGRRGGKAIASVAVLPLATGAADAEIDYLADGITESLINALSQLPKLRVMARSTVFRYKGRDVDAQTIGRDLDVRAVLLGRLQAVGERIVLRAELVDATDGSHLWGGQFPRARADVLALQEDLAQELVEQLRLRLTRGERQRLKKRHTANPRAYEAYMRGLFQLAKRTAEGLSQAIEYFDRAIVEDPSYALAHAGLADACTLIGAAAYVQSQATALSRARQAAERAIGLDETLAEAHSALGFVRFRIDWNWSGAETSLRRACELNPGLAPVHHRLALLMSALGRHDEAIASIRHALELDPLSLIIGTAHGRVLQFARRYADAVEQLRHTLELDPSFQQAHFDIGMAFAQMGRFADAKGEIEPLLASTERRSVMLAVLGNIYAVGGDESLARATVLELRERYAQGRATIADIGYVLTGLGEIDEAVTCFERGADERAGLTVFLKVEPMVDPLRTHPRFVSLMQRLRLA